MGADCPAGSAHGIGGCTLVIATSSGLHEPCGEEGMAPGPGLHRRPTEKGVSGSGTPMQSPAATLTDTIVQVQKQLKRKRASNGPVIAPLEKDLGTAQRRSAVGDGGELTVREEDGREEEGVGEAMDGRELRRSEVAVAIWNWGCGGCDLEGRRSGVTERMARFPLIIRRSTLQKLITESTTAPDDNGGKECTVQLDDLPGGPAAFDLAAKFCYDVQFEFNAANVVPIRCAAERLGMAGEGNLAGNAKAFFVRDVLGSWEDTVRALQACDDGDDGVPQHAEDLLLAPRMTRPDSITADETPLGELMPASTVAKLVDGYLAEVGTDANLKCSQFQQIAALVPDYVRSLEDGLYRAIDNFITAHPWLTESEREQLCWLMNCQKLSLEVCTHAAQNERLPLRVVVQVFIFEQLRLRTTVASWFFFGENNAAAAAQIEPPRAEQPSPAPRARSGEELRV
ncbi:putative BTB/POZ domain-containing protein [Hordeum vulgare]|nr:putative BTB/POZ domain-containing protein [Hordeum vulgare]